MVVNPYAFCFSHSGSIIFALVKLPAQTDFKTSLFFPSITPNFACLLFL